LLYRFADCTLDTERRELRRGADPVSIQPQVFDLLEFLIRNRVRVVSKDDLVEAIWNGRAISESLLTSRISAVRTAIGDSGEQQRLIRTVQRKGLRFVGEVREEDVVDGGRASAVNSPAGDVEAACCPPATAGAPAGAGFTAAPRPSVAVLPFISMSGAAEQDYFADGMVEDIITGLARFRSFFVIARNSTFAYKGRNVDIRQIGRELGVRYVVEGSIRTASNRIRVTAQLIEAESGTHIWADRYDRALGEIFAVQDEITRRIVGAIEPSIRLVEIERVKAKPTDSLDAYDLYLRALPEIFALTEESLLRAEALLRRALTLDPQYSDALAALADCRGRQWHTGGVPFETIPALQREAVDLARRAIAADPNNGPALAVGAYVLAVSGGQFEEAQELGARAVRVQPNSDYVLALCGQVLVHSGDSEAAIGFFEQARRLNPFDPRGYITLNGIAMAHFHAERMEQAEHWSRRALAERPTWHVARRYHAAALAYLGRVEEARAEIAALLVMQPNSSLTRSRTARFRFSTMSELYLDGLKKAGLPEG
jgi:TolB-like protein/DNA-binding winged helix-turn-helix (wHTH) protein/cytochrome c-type biogenesis protein CcmH/NrfG